MSYRTSVKQASIDAKVLASKSATKAEKSAAASSLVQRRK